MLLTHGRREGLCGRAGEAAGESEHAGGSGWRAPGWSVVSAGLSPVLLTTGWLVAGTLQPASYSPVRQTLSVMAGDGGTDRWIMALAMLATGGCYLVTAGGLYGLSPLARVLLAVAGVCSLGIVLAPDTGGGPTAPHIAFTVIGAVTITVWPAIAGWHAPLRPWAIGARGSLLVTLALSVMLAWVVVQTQDGTVLGLAERLTTSLATTWPFVVALLRWRPGTAGLPGATEVAVQGAAAAERRS